MYFITTIDSKDDDRRCVGYYSTFEKAEKAVLDNACDIWETCYDYVVIENVPEGLYQYDFHPTWYKWHKLAGGYVECEQPSFVTKHGSIGTIGYAIG